MVRSMSEAAGTALRLAAAAWPSGRPYASSFLPPGPTTGGGEGANAAGTRNLGYGQLRQSPSQTTAASPPLPPGVSLPTAAGLASLAGSLVPGDSMILTGARKHLTAASIKMGTGDYIGALAMLRSAQTGIHDEHRNRMLATAPAMAVVFAANGGFSGGVPPAEQSSAAAAVQTGMTGVADMKALDARVAQAIDRIRRYHFHGNFVGMPSTRI
jgi:hypothetical protein